MDDLTKIVNEQGRNFEVHRVTGDNTQSPQYQKVGKDEFLSKVNVAQMGAEVANELRGKTWDDRFAWITDIKDRGNKLFKEEKYDSAIDTYMRSLCGMDFSSYD